MKTAQSVKLGAWLLISLNLLMAFGSIWVFVRMAPAIDVIIVQNEVSLQACQDMLAALATDADTTGSIERFRKALERAGNNVTEAEEPVIIRKISESCDAAFSGTGRTKTIEAILELGTVNRNAMRQADQRAQQLGYAGAWGIVFMATAIFLIGMMFQHRLKTNLTEPLQEINAVTDAFCKGDAMRRCSLDRPPNNIKRVLNNVNQLLDQCCTVGNNSNDRSDEKEKSGW
ncbi:MAG: hypothetical protein JXR25_10205 [Pontiellaceae bacterium]|nr:hypothetical protein [Pontiellaceae bacterium]MBN2785191.1 hypothetical protein [Pontiellaceae bacterium]